MTGIFPGIFWVMDHGSLGFQTVSWFHCGTYLRAASIFYLLPPPVKLLSRVRLCDPVDCSLPGSSIHGIFQARVLEWVAISFYLLGVTKNLTLMIMNDRYPESWSLRLSA